jgi:hypothetical protein
MLPRRTLGVRARLSRPPLRGGPPARAVADGAGRQRGIAEFRFEFCACARRAPWKGTGVLIGISIRTVVVGLHPEMLSMGPTMMVGVVFVIYLYLPIHHLCDPRRHVLHCRTAVVGDLARCGAAAGSALSHFGLAAAG